MLETTKIYAVVRTCYLGSYCPTKEVDILGFTTSKDEAQYIVYNLEGSKSGYSFEYQVLNPYKIEHGKDYDQFVKSKIVEIEKHIKNKLDTSEKSNEEVKILQSELEFYKSKK